ncbi:hypothetical protein A2716_00370 [candidate division WWE3 bacterium RIFCSPHIGHO2_01_FULL_40_23]|uniref:Lipoprotein signal peptidase n=1 Tax=candidate division WWE3 bacterium RIFCSPLOWO2_01_FULL_41_18 TaxID=1802625 RepID=A0A1F4VDY2_UNCKA|nr:MAG: hypothetical protein A2716_00370 [candidate division WWE3 bacterium RIFCSPHIGHO2_01_FULL_40_23]OGC55451.1 MAG: hypothetical protein A3A78_00640 [candidate division WWE3 bacterium RIFCSPLOWO2_01_FULL_41_18]
MKFHPFYFCFFVIFIDRLSKFLILRLFPDIVSFNMGFMLGTGSYWSSFFNLFLVLCLILVFAYFFRNVSESFSYWFVIGGGVSNLIDRVFYGGKVVDFIPFFSFSVFNIADFFVALGIILMILEVSQLNNKPVGV